MLLLDEWISSYTFLGATSWFGHNFQVLVPILVGKWLGLAAVSICFMILSLVFDFMLQKQQMEQAGYSLNKTQAFKAF